MTSVGASHARDTALAIVSGGHLHQSLWIPETSDHPRLRVSYGTTSNFHDESLPAVLFIPPMFGSRWFLLEMDKLARDCGVRVVFPDRYSLYIRAVQEAPVSDKVSQTRYGWFYACLTEHPSASLARNGAITTGKGERKARQYCHSQRGRSVHSQHPRETTVHP